MHLRTPLVLVMFASSLAAQGGTVRPFGKGCPSAARDARGWTPHPGLGQLSLWGDQRMPNRPVVAYLGVSNRRWGGLKLPLALDRLGLTGCTLYVSLDLMQAGIARGGAFEARWPVPDAPSLAGAVLFGQLLGLRDPRVNPSFPLTTSSAVELRIGPVVPFRGLRTVGDPTKPAGAVWYYKGVDANVPYDLKGRIWRPAGNPPPGGFPAVIITHGGKGNVDNYTTAIAQRMVTWGLVCIGANMCHRSEIRPLGSPGGHHHGGGHPNNVLRAGKCWDILKGLGQVNMDKIGAHGSSAGGMLTIALAADPSAGKLRAASHTAAGIYDPLAPNWPSHATADKVRVPYLVQHGDRDTSVPIKLDEDYVKVLEKNNVPHRFVVWKGRGHGFGGRNSPVLDRVLDNVRAWFKQHGIL